MASQIIKVQRPVRTNDPGRPWLFYNEAQSIYIAVPERQVDPKIKKVMGHSHKIYIRGHLNGLHDNIVFVSVADTQEW